MKKGTPNTVATVLVIDQLHIKSLEESTLLFFVF
jgi:hypothetical protein